jgi:hypothetical protein
VQPPNREYDFCALEGGDRDEREIIKNLYSSLDQFQVEISVPRCIVYTILPKHEHDRSYASFEYVPGCTVICERLRVRTARQRLHEGANHIRRSILQTTQIHEHTDSKLLKHVDI